MSAVMQMPVGTQDGVFVTDTNQINLEAPRALFFAGDLIINARKRQIKEFKRGGYELDTPCAWRMKRYLGRAVITPLEIGFTPTAKENVPAGRRAYPIPVGPNDNPKDVKGKLLVQELPGKHITSIVHENPFGIVELRKLVDVPYTELVKLQNLFFPPTWEMPVHLRGIQEQVERTASQNRNARDIAEDMLISCETFRGWGLRQLEKEHSRLKKGGTGSFAYSYSELGEILLEQLEVQRQDEAFQHLAQSQAQLTQSMLHQNGLTPDVLTAIGEQNAEALKQGIAAAAQISAEVASKAFAETMKPFLEELKSRKRKEQA